MALEVSDYGIVKQEKNHEKCHVAVSIFSHPHGRDFQGCDEGSLPFADGVCHYPSCLGMHAPESFPRSILKGLWLRFPGKLSSTLMGAALGRSLALGVSGKLGREGSTFLNSGQGSGSELGAENPVPVCTFA